MSKHTPGPWFIETGYHYRAIRTSDEVIANMREIGHCFNDANARLIAAAPELFEALEAMMDYAGHPMSHPAAQLAIAAIAKATGEQQ